MSTERAETTGTGERIAEYVVNDGEMATGSTLGGPKICLTIKATGAIEKIYSVDAGKVVFGSVVLHHWDEQTGIQLAPLAGNFTIHPERQDHAFTLSNGVEVQESIFVLNGQHDGKSIDPPAAYYSVQLRNSSAEVAKMGSYAFAQVRGHLDHDVVASYNGRKHTFAAWNDQDTSLVRVFGISQEPTSFEATIDHAKAISERSPGLLSGTTEVPTGGDLLGVFHLRHTLEPGATARFWYTFSFSNKGKRTAERVYASCPPAADALAQTVAHYQEVLNRSVVITPDPIVNRGVLWAKANMLRTQLRPETGWSFVNDPTRSNNSVGRDTAWFAYGADYITRDFARESLLAYVDRQEPSGMIVEYYDIRDGKAADYHLNINDNTPLIVLALWHHYNATGDGEFLKKVYPAALKAARYILSQRDERGLVWCSSTGTSDWGIVGWRNVIQNYRLSGATTELNSECFAALQTVSSMARNLERHDESAEMGREADALRNAINEHLYNPSNKLYYLNIDVEGEPRSDITCDLVFPVMFGVADDEMAARIVSRLSSDDFWTEAGLRTVPRDAPDYGPIHGYGLLGGVWVAVAFWYAFAAAPFSPERMAFALSTTFRHYSRDPRRNNTVPGQFSEWLHGETLVNQGMMLSPWFPPRYLWAAIEGAGGLDLTGGSPSVTPRLAPDWKWLAVRSVPYHERTLTWFVVRAPDMCLYSDCAFHQPTPYLAYDEDISDKIRTSGVAATSVGLRRGDDFAILIGNASER
ncbi:MAG TPA: hypothetical protein VIG47_05175, partial [Gemmatimonadaceae bacterium]